MEKTEWIEALTENTNDVLQYEVPYEWLWSTLKTRAESDSVNIENDKETYIKGKTEHLYEHLEDKSFANEIYNLAIEDGVILNSRSLLIK